MQCSDWPSPAHEHRQRCAIAIFPIWAALASIVLQPTILLEADVRAGRLVQLFPEYGLPERPMHIVYLPDRYRSPRLRSFIDFVVERFGEAA